MGDCLSIHLGASEERKSRVRRWSEGSASSLYLPSRSARSRANLFISPLEKKKKKRKGREGRRAGERERERGKISTFKKKRKKRGISERFNQAALRR